MAAHHLACVYASMQIPLYIFYCGLDFQFSIAISAFKIKIFKIKAIKAFFQRGVSARFSEIVGSQSPFPFSGFANDEPNLWRYFAMLQDMVCNPINK